MTLREEYAEWKQITKFVTECRRQWPGAVIVLHPDATTDAAPKARAEQHPTPAPSP